MTGVQTCALPICFDHDRERHFFATHEGKTGFYVYTPLMLADGRALFVNRGFVPYVLKEPATRPEGQLAGAVDLTGLRSEERRGGNERVSRCRTRWSTCH